MSAGYLEKVSMKKKGKEKQNEEKLETVYIEDESGLGSGPPQPQTGEGAPPVGVIAVEIKEAGARHWRSSHCRSSQQEEQAASIPDLTLGTSGGNE